MPLVYEQQGPSADPTVQPPRPLTDRLKIPPVGGNPTDILTVVQEQIPPQTMWSSLRRRAMVRAARNLRMVDGDHWLTITEGTIRAGATGYQLKRVKRSSEAQFPTPVDNRLAPGVINELSRITRREYVPMVEPLRGLPRVADSALAGRRYLQWALRQQHWEDIKFAHAREAFICGTSVLGCRWDSPTGTWQFSPFPTARRCRICNAKLAEPAFSAQSLSDVLGGASRLSVVREQLIVRDVAPAADEGLEGEGYGQAPAVDIAPGGILGGLSETGEAPLRLASPDQCPFCSEGTLEPIAAEDRWAMDEMDAMGRPLGEVQPRGVGAVEHVTMFDVYPYNDGLSDPWVQPLYGTRTIRDVSWLCERYPEHEAQLDPQSPTELRRYHPVVGDAAAYWGSSDYTETSFRNHREVCELVVEPCRAHPDGRWIVTSGDILLKDEPLQEWIERVIPGYDKGPVRRDIRRVCYATTRFWDVSARYYWGTTPLNDAVKLNCRLNELDAQWVDIREHGSPTIALPPGVQVARGDDEGGMRILELTAPLGTDVKGLLIPSQPQTGNVYAPERNVVVQAIKDALGPHDVEAGDNPTGVNAATQLMILNEEAAKRREPAERAFIRAYEAIWSTLLGLTWAYQTWEDEYEAETAQGRSELKRFKGEDLAGQTVVKVTKEAGVDHSIFEAQSTKDGVEMGLVVPGQDPQQDLEIMTALKVPSTLNERVSLQVRRAEEAWQDFVTSRTIPVIDPILHNAAVRYGVLGRRWEGDDGAELQRKADWPQVLRSIHGWPEELQKLETSDAAIKTAYGPLAGRPEAEAKYVDTQAKATTALAGKKLFDQGRSVSELTPTDLEAALPQAEQVTQMPPPPPLGWTPLPGPLEERILYVLRQMRPAPVSEIEVPTEPLDAEGGLEPAGDDKAALQDAMLGMYAVIQAYRMLALPQAAAPAPPAPGGPAPAGAQQGGPGPQMPAGPAQG
jgi:hypothetical protein